LPGQIIREDMRWLAVGVSVGAKGNQAGKSIGPFEKIDHCFLLGHVAAGILDIVFHR
jgi:hypothetical protein